MRRSVATLVLFAVLIESAGSPALARAGEPKCPLPIAECLMGYQSARERPWLGVVIRSDSLTQARIIEQVTPGGPADVAGVRPGDVLLELGGATPGEWFAGKAGWKNGPATAVLVQRAGERRELAIEKRPIPEDLLARIVGVHMLEGHLAHMHGDDEARSH